MTFASTVNRDAFVATWRTLFRSLAEVNTDLTGDRGAVLSECGHYRYVLWRRWSDAELVTFVMLNPSTADATFDDPTIRRCIGFARSWGAGGVQVVNLYPWRATKPADLVRAGQWALGDLDVGVDLNDRALRAAAETCARLVVAWGAGVGPIPNQHARVLDLLRAVAPCPIVALGLTKSGRPRHPLYVRGDVELVLFGGAR